MQILSAADAISPAFERTKLVLFTPFRKGRTWKLSMTAYLSFVGTAFLPVFLLYAIGGGPILYSKFGRGAEYALVAVCLLLTAIYTVVFILCGRLQFAFFDIVLNRGEFVAPAWRKYKEQSWGFTGAKIIAGAVVTLVVSAPMIPLVRHIFAVMPAMRDSFRPGQAPPPELMSFMAETYGLYAIVFLVFGAYFIVMSTVSSFVVPSMALENSTLQDAFKRFLAFVRRETMQFLAFVAIRIGLGIVGYMMVTFIYEIFLFVVLLVVGLVLGLFGLVLYLIGIPSAVLTVLGAVIFGLLLFGLNIYILGLALGPFFTFFEAHTLYFLGGRYPMLGELLERSTPPAPVYFPHPGYYSQPQPPSAL